MLRMLVGKYTHKFLENGGESFSNMNDTIIIHKDQFSTHKLKEQSSFNSPYIEGISMKGFLLTSYAYKVLDDGNEMFSNMTHTIIIPK